MQKKASLKQRKKTQLYDSMDFYAQPMKSFQFEGRSKMHTNVGLCMTIFTVVLLTGYLVMQVLDMKHGHNPILGITNSLNQHTTEETALNIF
jgi:hypothetical protein